MAPLVVAPSAQNFDNGVEQRMPKLTTDISVFAEGVVRRASPRETVSAASASHPDPAAISTTSDGRVAAWNAGAEQICGYSAHEMIGRPIDALAARGRRKEFREVLELAGKGNWIDDFKTELVRRDGRKLQAAFSIAPIASSIGTIVGISIVGRDLVGRLEPPTQSRRNASARPIDSSMIAELAAALAHELNQPLTAIVNYLSAARRRLDRVDEEAIKIAREHTEKAAEQAMRASQVIRRVRDFVSHGQILRTEESLEHIVHEALELAAGNLDGVTVGTHFAPALPRVSIDRVQIEQVIVNLIRNAAEAMQGRQRRELTIATAHDDASSVQVSVSDTGPGLPQYVARHLFEPFVTTKKEGMGIGLVISRSVIETHGGRMWAARNLDGGATFSFLLPIGAS